MRISVLLSIALLLGLAAGSCRGTSEVSRGRKLGAAATLNACLENRVLPPMAQISGRADASMAGTNIGFSYRVHLRRDSLIWIKVTKFGFEGLRALIRPDSVFVINRLEKTYAATDYSLVKDFTGLEADFGLIQDLLFGNFHPIPETGTLVVKDKRTNPLQFTGEEAGYTFVYDIERPANRLVRMQANHGLRNEFMELLYTGFEIADNKPMAIQGELTVGMPDTARIAFSHSKVDLNPKKLSFSFSVPSNYTQTGK